jgi:glycerol-3-phosphate dehydrogenase (NAD(P)+)
MKNIIALGCGISDGLGFGDNTKAAIMTRGIHEIIQLGLKMGAELDTFAGLTGIGDLIVTCTSMHSRNRRAGILIGQGVSPEEAVRRVGTVEGYFCCKAAYGLAQKMGVEMPITCVLYDILYCGRSPKDALSTLMNRPWTTELEADFLKN